MDDRLDRIEEKLDRVLALLESKARGKKGEAERLADLLIAAAEGKAAPGSSVSWGEFCDLTPGLEDRSGAWKGVKNVLRDRGYKPVKCDDGSWRWEKE